MSTAVIVAVPRTAVADGGMSLGSHTLMTATRRPTLDASDTRAHVNLREFVDLHTDNVGWQGLEIEFSGVAGIDLAERPLEDPATEGDRAHGNVIVGLARWHDEERVVSLALGRQYLFAGAGRAEHLDGLSATYRTPWRVDLSVFGGRTRPWQLDYEPDSGDPSPNNEEYAWSNWAVGGRVRYRALDHAIASVGFIHEGHGSDVVRRNLSFQLGYWGLALLETLVGGVIDVSYGRPQELWVSLTSRPTWRLKLSADYRYEVPSLTIPKTSLFSVFSVDSYHRALVGAHYALTRALRGGVEGGLRLYDGVDELETGFTVAASLRLALGEMAKGSVGWRSEWIDAVDQWSLQNRVYGTYRWDMGLYANGEVYVLVLGADHTDDNGSDYERRIGDRRFSVGALGLLGYEITPRWSAQLAGSAFATPLADHDLRLLARATYRGNWSWQ